MKIKKVKKICDVAGCRNHDCFYISRTDGCGSVIICRDCLTEALDGIENYKEPKRKVMSEPPGLFFSVSAPQVQNEEGDPQGIEPEAENTAADGGDDKKETEDIETQTEADNGENAAEVKPKSKSRKPKAKAAKNEGEA